MSVLVDPVTVAVNVSDCETITVVEGVTVTVMTFVFPPPPQPANARRANVPTLGHRDAHVLRNFVNTITPKILAHPLARALELLALLRTVARHCTIPELANSRGWWPPKLRTFGLP